MKTVKIDFDVMEMMIFFWESVASKEKTGDDYFAAIAEKPQMQVAYTDGFTKDSVRRVLSAISNRERLNDRTLSESRFWNNNMRILEDLQVMHCMMVPIKTLNLQTEVEKQKLKTVYNDSEVIFIPAHLEPFYKKDNALYINFFELYPDFEDPSVIKIAGLTLKEYVIQKLNEESF